MYETGRDINDDLSTMNTVCETRHPRPVVAFLKIGQVLFLQLLHVQKISCLIIIEAAAVTIKVTRSHDAGQPATQPITPVSQRLGGEAPRIFNNSSCTH